MRGRPVEPLPSTFTFPHPSNWDDDDLVAVGADLAPGTLVAAYRRGLFPMHLSDGRLGWWSPMRRGMMPIDGLRVSRSLHRSLGRYRVTFDLAFEEVIDGCAGPERDGIWINGDIRRAYVTLHDLGWCHSVETWQDERLVGGLYGVAIGAAFFGESMFHRARDASKVALVRFVEAFRSGGGVLLDVQWATDHLRSMGAVEVDRQEYLQRLTIALSGGAEGTWARDRARGHG